MPNRKLSPEAAEVWAILKEVSASQRRAEARQRKTDAQLAKTDAQQRKTDAQLAKTDAQLAETDAQLAKTDAQLAKTDAQQRKTDAQLAATSKEVQKLTRKMSRDEGQWGKIAEALVRGQLIKLMKENFGIALDDVSLSTGGTRDGRPWEIDIIGVNGDVVVVVEVKTTLSISDTKYFLRNIIKRFSRLMPRYADRKVYAGLAYVKTGSNEANVVKHAEDNGLFVIKVINNTNKIVNSADFKLHDHRPDQGRNS